LAGYGELASWQDAVRCHELLYARVTDPRVIEVLRSTPTSPVVMRVLEPFFAEAAFEAEIRYQVAVPIARLRP
jgi:hypothetical protein